ncbi:MAG: ankyrin repeat domain-containing protein [Planctomycetes bacterium]|nr:ankyrin repeat domain-containing protein [Planctomycetota bacterium]
MGVLLALAPVLAEVAPSSDTAARLADAAEKNDAAAVRALLKDGAAVNVPQADGMTALHWAVYHDEIELTELLVNSDADVKAANRYGVPPLSIACMNGNGKIVDLLLEAGADPHTKLPGGETALMTAARTGRLGPVEALLARGADVNAKEHHGQTALMWAAAEGHVQVVEALLEAGADFRTPLASGFTPLFFAAREGKTDVALRLLKAGADVNAPMRPNRGPGSTALLLAVESGHFETALALLKAGAKPNAAPDGYTALHAITWVRKPIRGDGDPPPIGSGKLTALELVRQVAAHDADVNVRLKDGDSGRAKLTTTGATPFLLAARTSDVPLMKVLLDLGADPSLPNADNCTPLLAAASVGDLGSGEETAGTEDEAVAAVKLLLELGADIHAVDDNGETVMHGAAYQNWPRMVELLAANGADIEVWNRKNKWGWTPLLIARGHRSGNFRPDPATIAAIEKVMRAQGVTPPDAARGVGARQSYEVEPKDGPEPDASSRR